MKKIISAIAFVMIAVVSGSIFSIYGMNKSSVEVKDTPQAGINNTVQVDEKTFSCEVPGCTQIGEHSHGGNGEHHQSKHRSGHH